MQKTDQNEEKSKKACCILYVIELEIFTADRRTMEFSWNFFLFFPPIYSLLLHNICSKVSSQIGMESSSKVLCTLIQSWNIFSSNCRLYLWENEAKCRWWHSFAELWHHAAGEKMINHLQHAMFRRFMAIALSVHLTYEKIQPGNMEIRSV